MTSEELDKELKEILTNWSSGEFPDMNVTEELKQLISDVVAQAIDVNVQPAMESPQRGVDFLAGSQATLGAIKHKAAKLLGE